MVVLHVVRENPLNLHFISAKTVNSRHVGLGPIPHISECSLKNGIERKEVGGIL